MKKSGKRRRENKNIPPNRDKGKKTCLQRYKFQCKQNRGQLRIQIAEGIMLQVTGTFKSNFVCQKTYILYEYI